MLPWLRPNRLGRRARRVADEADEVSNGWTDLAAGLEVYRAATEEHPDDADLWFLYGDALATIDDWNRTETIARQGISAVGFNQDLWVLVLEALCARSLPDLVDRELDGPGHEGAHALIAPVYRARAAELRSDAQGAMSALSTAYDEYGTVVHYELVPARTVLDLATMLIRHGAIQEADYVLDTFSREADDLDAAWQAAAIGAALWRDTDRETADRYEERLRSDQDRSDDEISDAIADAAAMITPPGADTEADEGSRSVGDG
jgi:hypothetical protein